MMNELRSVLFDLDNTLLINDMDAFVPAYLKLISAYAAPLRDPKRFVQDMLAATDVMATNTDPAISNEKAFWDAFTELTGWDPAEMIPFFARFYEERFDGLRPLTQPRPEARPVVEWAFARGYQVVIATNPMFPRIATEKRLAWAGLGVDEFDYTLVTTYENMHATKPHREYYLEILDHVDCIPPQALMVGDDWERDIEPAGTVGMRTYWVDAGTSAEGGAAAGRGPLSALRTWLGDL
jgi:HAD superfamily hydrolase (TIGR01549 family)